MYGGGGGGGGQVISSGITCSLSYSHGFDCLAVVTASGHINQGLSQNLEKGVYDDNLGSAFSFRLLTNLL